MCEYCGCRDIPLIGRLTNEHYEAVDVLGQMRQALEANDEVAFHTACESMAEHLFPHNDSEEAGLFPELLKDPYFAPTVEGLLDDHDRFRDLVHGMLDGDTSLYGELEELLRTHIDKEENGLFPAIAVTLDGPTWEVVEDKTHDFNHATNREHSHMEHPGA